jgi:hypothetical protein
VQVQLWEWKGVDLREKPSVRVKHWFCGIILVELSVCIIPPIIYNLLPPWTYPVLRNHVNLLICVLFVFAFDPVCTTNWYQSIREARTLKNTFFISRFKVAEFAKFSDLDFDHLRGFLSSIRVRQYKDHQN